MYPQNKIKIRIGYLLPHFALAFFFPAFLPSGFVSSAASTFWWKSSGILNASRFALLFFTLPLAISSWQS